MAWLPFLLTLICTSMFVGGTWCLVKALGGAKDGNPVQPALFLVIGLGLKFPAAIYVLKILLSKNDNERYSAIAAVILVYFSTVLGMTYVSLKQNKKGL